MKSVRFSWYSEAYVVTNGLLGIRQWLGCWMNWTISALLIIYPSYLIWRGGKNISTKRLKLLRKYLWFQTIHHISTYWSIGIMSLQVRIKLSIVLQHSNHLPLHFQVSLLGQSCASLLSHGSPKTQSQVTNEKCQSYVPGSKLLLLGMVIPPLIRNAYNGYINPYYWVDDHPLLYGNNGRLYWLGSNKTPRNPTFTPRGKGGKFLVWGPTGLTARSHTVRFRHLWGF